MPQHHEKPDVEAFLELSSDDRRRCITVFDILVCLLGTFPQDSRDRGRKIKRHVGREAVVVAAVVV